ncbi:MAG: ABC transporter permease [Candidatus Acidiferrales bacterium]
MDFRYAFRMLKKSPSFAIIAILTISLGIACTSAVFSIVNSSVVQPLRYGHPDRIVLVRRMRRIGDVTDPYTREYLAYRDQSTVFEYLAAELVGSFDLRGDPPVRLLAAQVTPNFFDVVGVKPVLGRIFVEKEAASGSHVVVLSHRVWMNNFGSDQHIVGKTAILDGEPWTVIGVMPKGFEFLGADDVYIPLTNIEGIKSTILVVGLLKKDMSHAQAQAQLTSISERLAQDSPQNERGFRATVVPLREFLLGKRARLVLWVLLGAVGFVLLIACANVSNLLLARGASRQKEVAVRMALGAPRSRIVKQLLLESLLLASLGAALGLLLAYGAVRYLGSLSILYVPGIPPVRIDGMVVAFTVGVTALVTIVFSLLPALQTSNVDLIANIKSAATATIGVARHNRFRNMLVVAEVALSVILLAGAGLLIRTFIRVVDTPVGFQPKGVLTASLSLSIRRYPSDVAIRNFYEQVLEHVRAQPGVLSADISTNLPLRARAGVLYRLTSQPNDAEHLRIANLLSISESYFKTMGIPLIRGRAFTSDDTVTSSPVVIVDEVLAKALFKGEDPLGRRIILGRPITDTERIAQIVGIAADVKDSEIDEPSVHDIYIPYQQAPIRWEFLIVRTVGGPSLLLPSVRKAVATVDPDEPIEDVATMEEILNDSLGSRRFSTTLLGVFSFIALVLAAIGIYGVISYAVVQRTAEFGLRLALGATPQSLLMLVMRNGLRLAIIGCAVGTASALAVTRLMRGMIYGVSATDPLTLAASVVVIVLVAAAAVFIPARRAMRVSPIIALRYE